MCAADPNPSFDHWTVFEAAATIQTAPAEGALSPKADAIIAFYCISVTAASAKPLVDPSSAQKLKRQIIDMCNLSSEETRTQNENHG